MMENVNTVAVLNIQMATIISIPTKMVVPFPAKGVPVTPAALVVKANICHRGSGNLGRGNNLVHRLFLHALILVRHGSS